MKITYRQASRDDIVRQFRYYLLRQSVPEVAARFKEAVRITATAIKDQPLAAPLYRLRNPQLQDLRSWPIAGFEALRLYFVVGENAICVIRILHGRRNVRRILEQEKLQ